MRCNSIKVRQKWKWRSDRRSERHLCSCVKKIAIAVRCSIYQLSYEATDFGSRFRTFTATIIFISAVHIWFISYIINTKTEISMNLLTGPCDLQGFKLVWNEISHCRLFIETLPLEMFWLEKMKLVKWQTLEWQEMCKNKIFMKGRQRFVLYWKLTYNVGLARNPLPLHREKCVRFCWLCRCFLRFML